MAIRATETTLTFRRPFKLSALDHPCPAEPYRVAVDEDEILGLSFLAYRRTAPMRQVPALSTAAGPRQVFVVDADELAAAFEADRHDERDTRSNDGI
jgi:hypothetical protein